MPASTDQARPSLRERKKAQTRAAIQTHALRLFREQGYDATTIEQIIEAADVSETTFFRYFPTKEDVVLQDDFDPLIVGLTRRSHLACPRYQPCAPRSRRCSHVCPLNSKPSNGNGSRSSCQSPGCVRRCSTSSPRPCSSWPALWPSAPGAVPKTSPSALSPSPSEP